MQTLINAIQSCDIDKFERILKTMSIEQFTVKDLCSLYTQTNVSTNMVLHYLVYLSKKPNFESEFRNHIINTLETQDKAVAYLFFSFVYIIEGFNCIDHEQGFKYLLISAELNNHKAQEILGDSYLNGNICEVNSGEAAKWFYKAAIGGRPYSQYQYGILAITELNKVEDGLTYLLKATHNNHPMALLAMAELHCSGKHLQSIISQTIHYLQLSAHYGNNLASVYLALMTNESAPPEVLQAGLIFIKEQALLRKSNAMFFYGMSFLKGWHGTEDIAQASFWFENASLDNHAMATLMLGYIKAKMYSNNFAQVNKNDVVQCYKNAIKFGSVDAAYHLGVIYEQGDLVDKDLWQALQYYLSSFYSGLNCSKNKIFSLIDMHAHSVDIYRLHAKINNIKYQDVAATPQSISTNPYRALQTIVNNKHYDYILTASGEFYKHAIIMGLNSRHKSQLYITSNGMKKSKLLSLVTIFSSLTNNTGPTIIVTKNSKILFYLYMLCMQSMYYFSRANNLNLNLCSLIKIGELDSCIPIGALCNYKSSFNIYSSIVFITEVDCLKIPEHAKYDPLQSASFIYLYEPEKFTIDLIQKIKDCNNNKQKVVLAFSNDPSPQHRYIAELELHNTLAIDRAQAIGKKYISPRIIDPLSASFNLQNIESAIDNIIPFLNKLTPTGSTLGKTKGIIICEDDSIVHKFINKLLSIKHCVFINTNEFNKSQCPNSILLIAKSDYIHTSSTLAQWVFIAANPNDALIIDQAYKLFNYIEQTICYVITFNFEAVEDFAKYNDKIAFDMANQDFIENYTKNHEIVLNMSNPSKSRTMIAI